MLQIPQPIYDQIRRHGESAYPNECCGVLIGQSNDAGKAATRTVTHAIPVPNASPHPTRHYEIDPKNLIRIMRETNAAGPKTSPDTGPEILGFYHSHPDHPAQPSPTDLAEAHWIGCSYVITEVSNGKPATTNSFLLAGKIEEEKCFVSETIQLGD